MMFGSHYCMSVCSDELCVKYCLKHQITNTTYTSSVFQKPSYIWWSLSSVPKPSECPTVYIDGSLKRQVIRQHILLYTLRVQETSDSCIFLQYQDTLTCQNASVLACEVQRSRIRFSESVRSDDSVQWISSFRWFSSVNQFVQMIQFSESVRSDDSVQWIKKKDLISSV